MMAPLLVSDAVTIAPAELAWKAVRASGPGGQNVNKVASKVELRFHLSTSVVLDEATAARLRALARTRLDSAGDILITSQLTRDQSRNLEDAREKLKALIRRALERPTVRRATRPSRASVARRVNAKRQIADKKKGRKTASDD